MWDCPNDGLIVFYYGHDSGYTSVELLNMIRTIPILFYFLFFTQLNGQLAFQANEDSLIGLLNSMRSESDLNGMIEANLKFKNSLSQIVAEKDAFEYPFDRLSKLMSTLKSPDDRFRLFNWNVEKPDKSQLYFCLVVIPDGRKSKNKVIDCRDKSSNMRKSEFKSCTHKNWFGALYYEIIPYERNNKTEYLLLGWDGNNTLSSKKIIESFSISKSGKVKFGLPVLSSDSKVRKRVIFEYSDKAYMSLKFHKERKFDQIVFDHLSPETPQMEGFYQFYYPDFSYDAYRYLKGKWVYTPDVIVKSKGDGIKRPYNDPREDQIRFR